MIWRGVEVGVGLNRVLVWEMENKCAVLPADNESTTAERERERDEGKKKRDNENETHQKTQNIMNYKKINRT